VGRFTEGRRREAGRGPVVRRRRRGACGGGGGHGGSGGCCGGGGRSRGGGLVQAALRMVDMRGQMFGKIVSSRKALPAHFAVVGPLARVDPQVAGEVRLAPEGAPAEKAHEGPLARVFAHVQLQVLLGAHALAAEGAREAPLLALPQHRVEARLARVLEGLRAAVGGHRQRERQRVDGVVLLGVAAARARGQRRAAAVRRVPGPRLRLGLALQEPAAAQIVIIVQRKLVKILMLGFADGDTGRALGVEGHAGGDRLAGAGERVGVGVRGQVGPRRRRDPAADGGRRAGAGAGGARQRGLAVHGVAAHHEQHREAGAAEVRRRRLVPQRQRAVGADADALGRRARPRPQLLQRVVQAVLLEGLEVSELHAAHFAREQFVCGKTRAVVLLAVLEVGGSVAVALAADLATKGLLLAAPRRVPGTWGHSGVDGGQRRVLADVGGVLEGHVLLQEPAGGKRRQADDAPSAGRDVVGDARRRRRHQAVGVLEQRQHPARDRLLVVGPRAEARPRTGPRHGRPARPGDPRPERRAGPEVGDAQLEGRRRATAGLRLGAVEGSQLGRRVQCFRQRRVLQDKLHRQLFTWLFSSVFFFESPAKITQNGCR